MEAPSRKTVALALAGADSPGEQLAEAAADLEMRVYRADEPEDRFDELVRRPPLPVAVVIEAGLRRAEHLARRAARQAPFAQIVFLVASGELEDFEMRLRRLPLIGVHWTVARLQEGWPAAVREPIEVGARRQRHRTTLDRVNLKLREAPAIDAQGLRRLVVSERFLGAIVATASDAIVSLRPAGEILSWNGAAERLWRLPAASAVGRSFLALLTEDTAGRLRETLARVAESGKPATVDATAAVGASGGRVPLELNLAAIQDDAHTTAALSVIARDISERKRAEQVVRDHQQELERLVAERTARLSETIAQLEQFSYTVSHDIRAPLRAMYGYADVLLKEFGPDLPADAAEYARRIARAAGRLDRLTIDVLAYSRVAAVALEKRPVNLDELVTDVIAEYGPAAESFAIRRPLHRVLAHEALLAQAVGNLIGNAVKFVAPGEAPRVEISSERHGDRVQLAIRDHGIGISPTAARKLFGIFERGDAGKRYEGTGIGLAIVKKSVERLGGTVSYAPAPAAGSIFTLELPAAES